MSNALQISVTTQRLVENISVVKHAILQVRLLESEAHKRLCEREGEGEGEVTLS
jgi:hypothetical protein